MSKNRFQKVFDSRNRRVRGLWKRNGIYYAQLVTVDGSNKATKIPLHGAQTVPQAIDAMQEKKSARTKRELIIEKVRGVLTLKEAGQGYLNTLKALESKSESTQDLHGYCLDRWNEFAGGTPISKINAAFVHRYAEWRKPQKVAGRTIDIEVSVLRKTLEWAVTRDQLRDVPNFRWKRLQEPSEEKRLLTEDEIERVCNAAIAVGNQQVADHLRLLAYTGMREQEGCRVRWCDVDWTNKQIRVARVVDIGGSLTANATADIAGDKKRTKNKQGRVIDFNPRLEAHLKDLFARRDPNAQWLFPSPRPDGRGDVPVQDLRKSRDAAIAGAKVEHFGFHHLRHYFISVCVMSGIDFMTIADWVGHQDRGVLICRTYAHLCDAHKKHQAAKVSFSSRVIDLASAA